MNILYLSLISLPIETTPSIDRSVHLEMGIPAPCELVVEERKVKMRDDEERENMKKGS